MPRLENMKTWRDRLGHSGLRSFTDEQGHLWLEQNPAKGSRWAKLAKEGHEVAWEFEKAGGGYTGRILIDREIYSTSEGDKEVLAARKDGHPVSNLPTTSLDFGPCGYRVYEHEQCSFASAGARDDGTGVTVVAFIRIGTSDARGFRYHGDAVHRSEGRRFRGPRG